MIRSYNTSRYGMIPGGDDCINGTKPLITAAQEELDLKFCRAPNLLELYKRRYVEEAHHDRNTPVNRP